MRKKYTNQIRRFPIKIGAASLAIIIGIGNGLIETADIILEGPQPLGRAYDKKIKNQKKFHDYYEELKNIKENSLKTMLWRLERKGLIKRNKNNLSLTNLGLEYFKKVEKNKEEWDGKWRIIMFDIPEKLKKERAWLRGRLYGLNYKLFQKSVFIGKYPMDEDLFKEITKRQLNNYINLLTVGEIDNEEILR